MLKYLLLILSVISVIPACEVVDTYPAQVRPGPPTVAEKSVPLEYRIQPEDIVAIFVWQHGDLSMDAIVRPDGKISYPLAGDIQAEGLTLTELDEEITKRLREYIRDADVSVSMRKFAGEKVFIFGEVGQPGVYSFVGKTYLMQILAEAKGWTKDAKLSNVLIIRGDITSENPDVTVVNVDDIRFKGDLRQNVLIYPKDIIYVPSTPIADINRYLRDYITPLFQTIVTVDYFRKR